MKTELQNEALQAWRDNQSIGSVFLPPGSGKTRLGKMAYESMGRPNTLIVTSRKPLVDQWKEEGLTEVEILCINTAYKKVIEVDLLIVDEVHRTLSPQFRKLYINVKYKWILTLTGTPPEDPEYKDFLENIAPKVYEKTLSEVQEMGGVVSPSRIYNLQCSFDPKNKAKYRIFDAQFMEASIRLSQKKKAYPHIKSVFDLAKVARYSNEFDGETSALSKKFWAAMTLRKQAVYDNEAKIDVAKNCINLFPNRKWIIFTKTIALAEKVAAATGSLLYHSKLKTKERKEILEKFATTSLHLVAVDALNEGLNVPSADGALILSGVSKILTNVQQLGRVSREVAGKRALIINAVTKDTVEGRWVKSKNEGLITVETDSLEDIQKSERHY